MAFNYNYKPIDYRTAQKQVAGQVDPLFNRAVQGVNQQKHQNDVQAGQVSASRGLAHSGLAADQLNKIAIASQGQIGDLNAQRATQTSQLANDLVWRDKEFGMQDRSQKFNEYNTNRGFNYQAGRDKIGDAQWNKQYDYQKGRDGVGDSQWDKQFKAGRTDAASEQAWRKYQYNNMSATEKAQIAQNKSQFGEEMAWKLYALEYQGELDKSIADTQMDGYNGNFNRGTGGGPGGPQDYGTEQLGSLSRKYESSGNPGVVARTRGDLGGASYGSYQLTTSSGHAQSFANNYGGALRGLKAGTASFDRAWKAEASRNPKAFGNAQHNYIQRNHYAPAASRFKSVTGIDASKMPKAVQDMIWSIGVQHGAGGAARLFKNSGVRAGMNAASIITRVYNERMNVDRYFSSSPRNIKNGVYNRFKRELSDALNMLRR